MGKNLIPLVFILAFLHHLQAQSPWVRSKAGFYAQVAIQSIPDYREVLNGSAENIPLAGKYREVAGQLYLEYGLSAKVTGILSIPLRNVSRLPSISSIYPSGNRFGLGNVQMGLKTNRNLLGGKIAFLLLGDLPAGPVGDNGLRTGFPAWTLQPVVSYGWGFRRAYCFGYGGYGLRSNKFSQFLRLGMEGGVHFGQIWLVGVTEWMNSANNGSYQFVYPEEPLALFADQQEWWSVGVKSIVEINRFIGLAFSASGAFWGQNVANRPSLSAAFYFKWD